MLKLDLGAGARSPEGFRPMGNRHGTEIFPLAGIADASCQEIRASHVLEHFPAGQIQEVLAEWVRCLAPGGRLSIAVPDFAKIAENYAAGVQQPTESYIMGGQTAPDDFHMALFDKRSLTRALAASGLMLIRSWSSELDDCAALPISLNLCGTRPHQAEIAVSAVMSVPRLGFMDNMFSCVEAFPGLNVKLRRHSGAYWGQCVERVMEETLREDDPDAVLTLDYDTVFAKRDVSLLMQLMCCHPEADAIAALQSGRGKDLPLFTRRGENGANEGHIKSRELAEDLTRMSTAHFGLTLIRSDKLKALPKPWFHDVPDQDGGWGEGRVDADVSFWRKWEAAGNSLFIANRVPVGHLELCVLWPGQDLRAIRQPVSEWREKGKPKEAWT